MYVHVMELLVPIAGDKKLFALEKVQYLNMCGMQFLSFIQDKG